MRELLAMMMATSVVAIQNGPYLTLRQLLQIRSVADDLVEGWSQYE